MIRLRLSILMRSLFIIIMDYVSIGTNDMVGIGTNRGNTIEIREVTSSKL